MAHKLLDRSYIDAVFQKMGCKTVAECVRPHGFQDAALFYSGFNRLLKPGLLHVMPTFFAGAGIYA